MTQSQILADSINPAGVRITSWLLTYPRFIHSEMMTHRVYSRNAASSRALPWKKVIDSIKSNPAMPAVWGAEQKGMQSGDDLPKHLIAFCEAQWMHARDYMIDFAIELANAGLHKGIVNRLLEPFAHTTAIFTTTDHQNFFSIRAHKDADKTFQALAFPMLEQYLASTPWEMKWGAWHIPRFPNTPGEADYGLSLEDMTLIKVATARCARLSYLTFDGEFSIEKDMSMHDRLAEAGHWSPFEHCAQAVPESNYPLSNYDNIKLPDDWDMPGAIRLAEIEGLSHWKQYRKFFPDENRTNVDLAAILRQKPEWLN